MRNLKNLFEDFLGKHREIDTPVAPDMTAISLHILILVTFGVPVVAQIDCALVEEIGLSHTHPVEFRLATEEACRLLCEIRVVLDLLGEGLVTVVTFAEMQTCGKEAVVVEHGGIGEADGKGMAATH